MSKDNIKLQDSCYCKNCEGDCMKKSREMLPKEVVEYIDQCMQSEEPKSQLITVLHKVQEQLGYLSQQSMDAVAYLMQIPAAKVSGVASFYQYFRLKACGKYVISICMGTACYVKGAESILEKFSEELGIKSGETTKDEIFTLEVSRCLGACALAPVVKIGDEVYSEVTQDKVPGILKNYFDKEFNSKN